eukprot:1107494-Pelagomonas_calceolata.AAC.3
MSGSLPFERKVPAVVWQPGRLRLFVLGDTDDTTTMMAALNFHPKGIHLVEGFVLAKMQQDW